MSPRESGDLHEGFYCIRLIGTHRTTDWQVGYYHEGQRNWSICGHEARWPDAQIQVGRPVEMPEPENPYRGINRI